MASIESFWPCGPYSHGEANTAIGAHLVFMECLKSIPIVQTKAPLRCGNLSPICHQWIVVVSLLLKERRDLTHESLSGMRATRRAFGLSVTCYQRFVMADAS